MEKYDKITGIAILNVVHWHIEDFIVLRGGAVVARYAHNVEVAGSIPAPASFGLSYKALINFV